MGEFRTWTDDTNTFSVIATLVRATDGQVTLHKKSGDEIHLPINRLSEDDQAFVEYELATKRSQQVGGYDA